MGLDIRAAEATAGIYPESGSLDHGGFSTYIDVWSRRTLPAIAGTASPSDAKTFRSRPNPNPAMRGCHFRMDRGRSYCDLRPIFSGN